MPEPILAKDVIIQFLSGSDYITYGCAENLETTFSMETKSVKTIGDGVWKRKRGQSLGQVINLTGVVKRDTSSYDAFDLLDNYKSMTDVAFKIFFYDEAGVAKILKGYALPVEVNLSAGSEGFASGSITLEVNGDPDYVPASPPPDPLDPDDCVAEIETAHAESRPTSVPGLPFPINRWYAVIDTMVSGSATISRWDFSVDGGGTQTAFTDGNIPTSWILPLFHGLETSHTITITPICDNGFSGEPFTFNFTS
jgi:hypothetical protein